MNFKGGIFFSLEISKVLPKHFLRTPAMEIHETCMKVEVKKKQFKFKARFRTTFVLQDTKIYLVDTFESIE